MLRLADVRIPVRIAMAGALARLAFADLVGERSRRGMAGLGAGPGP